VVHTFSIGQSLRKRAAHALKRLGSMAEVFRTHPLLPTEEQGSTHAEPRLGNQEAQVDRRRSDAVAPVGDMPRLSLVEERRLGNQKGQVGRRRSDGVPPVSDTPRLLLIEPDQVTRVLYASMFEDAGYAVYAVAEGIEAIDVARVRLPDVVVIDLAAPAPDGFEILRQWGEDPHTSRIPIIVVTSSLQFDVPPRSRAGGAISVLTKPMSPETLLAEVDELMRATPRERLVVRRLRRTLLILRELGRRAKPEDRGQERVRSLIDRLQIAILALDSQGRYVAVSRGASTLTGYSRAELLGTSIHHAGLVLAPTESEQWRELLSQQQAAAGTVIRDRSGNTVSVQTEFATVLPGLHVAAFADQNAAEHVQTTC
jgi:PAS domain S-box-containing protein